MRIPFDLSIFCFALVVIAAVSVATLRSSTYSLGYELGKLKQQEQELLQEQAELLYKLSLEETKIRQQFLYHKEWKFPGLMEIQEVKETLP